MVTGGSDDARPWASSPPNGGSLVVGRVDALASGNRTGIRPVFLRRHPDDRADSGFGPSGDGRQLLDVLPGFDHIEL